MLSRSKFKKMIKIDFRSGTSRQKLAVIIAYNNLYEKRVVVHRRCDVFAMDILHERGTSVCA